MHSETGAGYSGAQKAAAKALTGKVKAGSPDQREAFSPKETGQTAVENVAAAELRQFVERVERLEEEKADLAVDIRDVLGEAKSRGYDTKAIRTIVKMRKKDVNERLEEESILETYMAALGMMTALPEG